MSRQSGNDGPPWSSFWYDISCDSSGKFLIPNTIQCVDIVEIQSGTLANFIAKVESIDSNRIIWVLMNLMEKVTRVQIASGLLHSNKQ
ncbi:hypothetical protein OA328_00060 [Paracoccaceae bacterium]|nr:hypothetical protein [Paracoccaceae bacterium]